MIRVLVVEDNPDLAHVLRDLLRQEYEVEVAGTGEAGVDAARVFEPHVVIMDLRLPGMNGVEAAKAIRRQQNGRDPAIIALTATADVETPVEVLEKTFDAYLIKPSPLQRIRGAVQEVAAARGWEAGPT